MLTATEYQNLKSNTISPKGDYEDQTFDIRHHNMRSEQTSMHSLKKQQEIHVDIKKQQYSSVLPIKENTSFLSHLEVQK